MNRRLAANPSYMYGSHFGAIPQVDAGSATAMVMVGAVVGAVASAVLVGSDPVKNAKLRSMVSSRGSLATGAAIGAGLGLLISGAGFIHQQGGFS
tara:strand:- start:194 stop:478 length:285 start_codon:yes stop_codon:yes gene_type:complete